MAVSVLVLKTFAREGGPPRRASHHESPAFHVGGGPDKVPYSLKAEHRVVNEKGDGVYAVCRVGCAGRYEGRHAARLCYALFEYLPVLCLLVVKEGVRVNGFVELSHA